MNYLDCWISVASALFSQALAGTPELVEGEPEQAAAEVFGFTATLAGDLAGSFSVALDAGVVNAPLLGEGTDQKEGWAELLHEVASAAAGELRARTGQESRIESFGPIAGSLRATRAFALRTTGALWAVLVEDNTRSVQQEVGRKCGELNPEHEGPPDAGKGGPSLELLLDVELDASLRFGCREMPLGELLALGPGAVLELDRQVADPVDLIVGDKIVARGEVVLVNGNFGLRVTEVAAPRKRLESIRCLF